MRKNKGFTLIELMVVILIVAILAAVLAPMMTGRIRQAKWSEGKAGAGTLATGIRALIAENGGCLTTLKDYPIYSGGASGATANSFAVIGVTDPDLRGKYFSAKDYAVSAIVWDPAAGTATYTITVTAPSCIDPDGETWQLDGGGEWKYTPGT